MSEELKACPFCGCEAKVWKGGGWSSYKYSVEPSMIKIRDLQSGDTYFAGCKKCLESKGGNTLEDAIKRWNTRPLEDALRSRVEELERENAHLKISWNKTSDEWRKRLYEVASLQIELENKEAELARLREMVRWRNYPEEKPEKPGRYICELSGKFSADKMYLDIACYSGDGWGPYADVIRYLPIPPEVE